MGGGPDILGGVQCLRVFEEELCTEFLLTKSGELICWKGSCHITSKKRSYGTILRWAKIPRYCIVNNHILFLTSQNWIQPFHSGATSSELCWTNYCVFCTIQTERRVCIGHPTIPWYKEYNKPLFQDPIIYHTRNINHEPCVNPWVCVKELFRKKRHFISSMHLFPNFQIHWTAELQKKQTKHPSSIHPIFPEVLVFLTTNLSSAPPKKKTANPIWPNLPEATAESTWTQPRELEGWQQRHVPGWEPAVERSSDGSSDGWCPMSWR